MGRSPVIQRRYVLHSRGTLGRIRLIRWSISLSHALFPLPLSCLTSSRFFSFQLFRSFSHRWFHWFIASVLLCGIVLLSTGCGLRSSDQMVTGGAPAEAKTIENKGSDTLVNLALAWAETYMKEHPDVRISVTGGGSGTGIAAMINGTVDIANASRRMKPEEIAAARANNINPVEFVVARDAVAVVVHPSNPVNGLTLQQISDIYTGKIINWKEVGGEDRPIVLLSRESSSGTYVYFLEHAVRLGNKHSDLLFSPDTLLMPSSEGISAEIRQNPNAIGYDGLGYVTPDQKVLAIARDANGPYVLPSIETVNDGSYPIARPLFMYTAGEPTGHIKEYLDWIRTDGQALVPKLGFVPLRQP
ncbi:MAG: phosphate ABC transporter substrate-binding protein [Anaerolineae bacterium]|nr:phosphate ABC transporter substrate-binding protein [Anaerolineae bacterium]